MVVAFRGVDHSCVEGFVEEFLELVDVVAFARRLRPIVGLLALVDGALEHEDAETAPFADGEFFDQVSLAEIAGFVIVACVFEKSLEESYLFAVEDDEIEVSLSWFASIRHGAP